MARRPELAEPLRRLGAEVVRGDVSDSNSIASALAGVETVVHLAAFFRGATPEEAHQTNVTGSEALAAAALPAGVRRFVFSSSNTVYGPGQGRPAREEDPLSPTNFYSNSKAAAEERLMQLHSQEGLGLRILRFAFVYGEGDPHLREYFPRMQDWNPARRLQMVHHADVGQALLRAVEAPGIDGRVYNIADDSPVTAFDLAASIGQPLTPGTETQAPFDAWEMIVNTSRARRELGFRPIYPSYASALDAGAV